MLPIALDLVTSARFVQAINSTFKSTAREALQLWLRELKTLEAMELLVWLGSASERDDARQRASSPVTTRLPCLTFLQLRNLTHSPARYDTDSTVGPILFYSK